MRILHLFSEQSAAAIRQIELLVGALPRQTQWKAIGLGQSGPIAPPSFDYERLIVRPLTTHWQMARRIRAWNAEVVHIWLPSLENRLKSVLRICRAAGAGVVISDQHGMTSHSKPLTAGLPVRWLASSDSIAATLSDAGVHAPHVVRWAVAASQDATPAFSPSLSADPPTIVSTGRLARHKRFKDLIWAITMLEQVTPIRLCVAGHGPLRDRLEVYRDQVNVYRSTHFIGHDGDWVRRLGNAVCYWSASGRTGQSLSLTEAMCAGTPVVAVDTPTNRELIRSGENGFLVSPGSIGFARQARVLINDDAMREDLAAAARESVTRMCDVATMTSHVQEHYAEAVRKAA